MALVLLSPECTPSTFVPPQAVEITVGVWDTNEDTTVHITYRAAPPLQINGGAQVDGGHHAATVVERLIQSSLVVSGPSGTYELIVTGEPVDDAGKPIGPSVLRTFQLNLGTS